MIAKGTRVISVKVQVGIDLVHVSVSNPRGGGGIGHRVGILTFPPPRD